MLKIKSLQSRYRRLPQFKTNRVELDQVCLWQRRVVLANRAEAKEAKCVKAATLVSVRKLKSAKAPGKLQRFNNDIKQIFEMA